MVEEGLSRGMLSQEELMHLGHRIMRGIVATLLVAHCPEGCPGIAAQAHVTMVAPQARIK